MILFQFTLKGSFYRLVFIIWSNRKHVQDMELRLDFNMMLNCK